MATEIRVPALGESVSEAIVAQWYKSPGDHVTADEPILELETDKVTLEVNSPVEGMLEQIEVSVGDTVEIGALLGAIAEGGAAAQETVAKEEAKPEPAQDTAPAEAPTPEPAVAPAPAQEPESVPLSAMPAAPSAARMMAENKIDPNTVEGSGKRGQILKEDVIAQAKDEVLAKAPKQPAPAPVAPSTQAPVSQPQTGEQASNNMSAREERVPMSRLRQTIATRLKDAQNTAAILTTFNDVDMSAVMALRKDYKDLFEKKHGVKLGFMGFFVKACIQALKDVPEVNAQIDGTDVIYKNYYHIGVAVGTEKGLVVPVVKNADQLTLAGIERAIGEFGSKARDGKLSIADMQGGTFTLSNGGVYGSLLSTPILNAPQSGILGMHRIEQRPVVKDGEVVVRPMMYLAMSYDHRIVDGKGAVTFLVRVKEALEDPQRLMLDL